MIEKSALSANDNEESSFIKEVVRYYVDFLETNFEKGGTPKRNTVQKSKNGLRTGFSVDRYPELKERIFTLLRRDTNITTLEIEKGDFSIRLTRNLEKELESSVQAVSKSRVSSLGKDIGSAVLVEHEKLSSNYDYFFESVSEKTKHILLKDFATPFLDSSEILLDKLSIDGERGKFQLQLDLANFIYNYFHERYTRALDFFFHEKEFVDIVKLVKGVFNEEDIKSSLLLFFESYTARDAYDEIYTLYRNQKIIRNIDCYLYLYEVAFGGRRFPLLYLPVNITKKSNRFVITISKRLFFNKLAVDYILSESYTDKQRDVSEIRELPQILTSGEDLSYKIKQVIGLVENTLSLNRNIDTNNADYQLGANLSLSLSNKSYFFLYEREEDGLIKCYKELLKDHRTNYNFEKILSAVLAAPRGGKTKQLIDEWESKTIFEKLLVDTPFSLNDEQKIVVNAVNEKETGAVIVEGPPGTGKSRAIASIICTKSDQSKATVVISDNDRSLESIKREVDFAFGKIKEEYGASFPIVDFSNKNDIFSSIAPENIACLQRFCKDYEDREHSMQEKLAFEQNNIKKNIEENIQLFSVDDTNKEGYQKVSKVFAENNVTEKEILPVDILKVHQAVTKINSFESSSPLPLSLADNDTQDMLKVLKENILQNKDNVSNSKSFPGVKLEDVEILISSKEKIKSIIKHNHILDELITDRKIINDTHLKRQALLFKGAYRITDRDNPLISKGGDLSFLEHFYFAKNKTLKEAQAELEGYLSVLRDIKSSLFGARLKQGRIKQETQKLRIFFPYFTVTDPEQNIDIIDKALSFFRYCNYLAPNSEESVRVVITVLSQNNIFYYRPLFKKIFLLMAKAHKVTAKIVNTSPNIKGELLQDVVESLRGEKKRKDNEENIERLQLNLKREKGVIVETTEISVNSVIEVSRDITAIKDTALFLIDFIACNPELARKLKITTTVEDLTCSECVLSLLTENDVVSYYKYEQSLDQVQQKIKMLSSTSLSENVDVIKDILQQKTFYHFAKKAISGVKDFQFDTDKIKERISCGERLNDDEFESLKSIFSCFLGDISSYAGFFPLERDILDCLVIDEAEEINNAQALYAISKAKKVVLFGDEKQPTVSSLNYDNHARDVDIESIATNFFSEGDRWEKDVQKAFSVNCSVFRLVSIMADYHLRLRRHARCYPEIISYSNKNFYNNSLLPMRLRDVPAEEVLKFDFVTSGGKESVNNVNSKEVKAVIATLNNIKEKGEKQRIAVLTPYQEQAVAVFDEVVKMKDAEWFFKECQLEVLTFKKCQGEESDYAIYSFVKNHGGELDYTYFNKKELNVALSRARKTAHFILSAPVKDYHGVTGEALLHFSEQLSNASKKTNQELVEAIKESVFYRENKNNFLEPQELTELTKIPLATTGHSAIARFKNNKVVVIQVDARQINLLGKKQLIDAVYEQKILESYGYYFVVITENENAKIGGDFTEKMRVTTKEVSVVDVDKCATEERSVSLNNAQDKEDVVGAITVNNSRDIVTNISSESTSESAFNKEGDNKNNSSSNSSIKKPLSREEIRQFVVTDRKIPETTTREFSSIRREKMAVRELQKRLEKARKDELANIEITAARKNIIREEQERVSRELKKSSSKSEKEMLKERQKKMEKDMKKILQEEKENDIEKRMESIDKRLKEASKRYVDLLNKERDVRSSIGINKDWGPESRRKKTDVVDFYRSVDKRRYIDNENSRYNFSIKEDENNKKGRLLNNQHLAYLVDYFRPSKDLSLKSPYILSVDISDYSIKLMSVNRKGAVTFYKYEKMDEGIIYNGEIRDKDRFKHHFENIIKESKIERIRKQKDPRIKILLSLPESKVFIHQFKLDKDEAIDQKIREVVSRNIPIPIEKLYFYYHTIPLPEDEEKLVLCSAVEEKVVLDYMRVFQQMDMDPVVFDIGGCAVGRAFLDQSRGRRKIIGKESPCHMIVDIGARITTINIYQEDLLSFSVSVPFGGAYLTDYISQKLNMSRSHAEERKIRLGLSGEAQDVVSAFLDKIVREVKDAQKYYTKEFEEEVEKIIITGGTSQLKGLLSYFKKEFGGIIVIGDSLKKIKSSKKKKDVDSSLAASVIGLAIRSRQRDFIENSFNLLPKDVKKQEKKLQQERNITLRMVTLLLVFAGFLFLAIAVYHVYINPETFEHYFSNTGHTFR